MINSIGLLVYVLKAILKNQRNGIVMRCFATVFEINQPTIYTPNKQQSTSPNYKV